ncbi:MAG: hypothetical protein KAH18_02370 [Psychromonas sp.]|nr:hypothetical protein [Psychromonas sp.]
MVDFLQTKKISTNDDIIYLIDPFPIPLANNHYDYTAEVAAEIASKIFNSTNKMYYYSAKVHIVARKLKASLPDLEIIFIEEAKRQQIEALFAWLNKVTDIEDASNVRSSKGLLTHTYGRLAAAIILRS